ncbi:glycoside hydrolase family 15 protein [filamentous cyanobacterium LEGE 11480]|uniref:Glycoside hydrolase family 15 protein n=1 Tax=Romeriopsis navalis LEGE 11480 TaxID=2777977 RepID=A0A928VLS5_9CYAN|nr:glycoside hydrolase family 15 protein [Romeriopsis navalis]MBE9030068.1 glycoside hydrolase family 15 protein [Romeriopsis navalis LEGE 11480]
MVAIQSTPESRLDRYYQQVKAVILDRQNPISGLLPASTAVNDHGDYTDAWVRDNVYSIQAVWGLALAYGKAEVDPGRTFELEHSVVKLMRGLLFAMMRQSEKVEAFKHTQSPMDALHAKYNTAIGATVVPDDGWGHLQIDATSIFLLMLAQMTASGLSIVFNQDEVNFVQNLVYYIGRAYRTPDYGIWERGNKVNHGSPELNASSIGMAKAALTAMDGFNVFGINGGPASVIHVMPDEIARCRMILESLLPRESSSKEVDAALLSVISFPAFAIENLDLLDRTRSKITDCLEGAYGCKRFLRDGHQTVIEDTTRLHYEPRELKQFEHIECEWPLFFTYLALDGIFRGDRDQAADYLAKLDKVAVEQDGIKLLPEVYYVPEELVDAEKANPQTQIRQPNDNLPLVWAQSLYYMGQMLHEGLIGPSDVDPLNLHKRLGSTRRVTVQVALLAEDESLKDRLAAFNVPTETLQEIAPVQVRQAKELSMAYTQLGHNDKLSLTGRPQRLMRSMSTSKVYKFGNDTFVFLPTSLERDRFYITLDYHFLISNFKSELSYIQRHWRQLGRPLVTLMITHDMLDKGMDTLLKMVQELQDGICAEVPVKLGPMKQMMLTASRDRLDFLPDFDGAAYTEAAFYKPYLQYEPSQTAPLSSLQEFMLEQETDESALAQRLQASRNLYEKVEILATLVNLKGLMFDTGIGEDGESVRVGRLIDELYRKASRGDANGRPYWGIVRRAAGLLDKVDAALTDAVAEILVRQKQIAVGLSYSEAALITQPLPHNELLEKLRTLCREDIRDRVLTQEILIYLSSLMKAEPTMVQGLLTLRVGYFIVLMTNDLAQELEVTQDEAYEKLMQLSPYEIKMRLAQILLGYEQRTRSVFQRESLQLGLKEAEIDWIVPIDEPEDAQDWLRYRQMEGGRGGVPQDFYPSVWKLLHHCKGLIIGDKLERRNRLESESLVFEMTAGEKNFALQVDHLLNKIPAPEYRHVNIEALMELSVIMEKNPDIKIPDYIVLDILIGHAVRLAWLDRHPEHTDCYDEYKTSAWSSFYTSSTYACAAFVAKALQFLTRLGQTSEGLDHSETSETAEVAESI